MEEIRDLMQSNCIVCLNEMARSVAGQRRIEQKNKTVKSQLVMVSRHGAEVLVDQLEEKVLHQGCAQSLEIIWHSVIRCDFVGRGHTPRLKDRVKGGTIPLTI